MSKLEFFSRPWVAFDADIKEHRRIFNQFKRTMSWGHSPYRFILPDEAGFDLVTMMEKATLSYYMDKEFGKPLPVETARKDVQKVKKLVDKKKV
jgi:hypothetical protein